MIHPLLSLLGVFMVGWGIVICALLVSLSLKGPKWIWLVTAPGIFIVAFLGFDFACPTLSLSAALSHEKQIANGIQWGGRTALLLLVARRLYEWRQKKRSGTASLPLAQKPENL